jgi:hypothetical protein
MQRMFVIVGLLCGLATGVATAQTRVGVSLSFGDPYFGGHVVIGRPHYHRYARPYYYSEPRVIVIRPYRYRLRGHHRRGW